MFLKMSKKGVDGKTKNEPFKFNYVAGETEQALLMNPLCIHVEGKPCQTEKRKIQNQSQIKSLIGKSVSH